MELTKYQGKPNVTDTATGIKYKWNKESKTYVPVEGQTSNTPTTETSNITETETSKAPEPIVSKEKPKEATVNISVMELFALLDKRDEALIAKIGKSNGMINAGAALKHDEKGNVVTDDIDEDDYLEEPVLFWTRSRSYTIFDDKRRGVIMNPPGSYVDPESKRPVSVPVRFKMAQARKVKNEFGKSSLDYISVMECRSKKLAKWMREHTLFGYRFFEDIRTAESIDVYLQSKLVEAASKANGMTAEAVMQYCKNANDPINLPVLKEVEKMKRNIAMTMALEMIKQDKEKNKSAAVEALLNFKNLTSGRLAQTFSVAKA